MGWSAVAAYSAKVGRLVYGSGRQPFELDDRVLAHLRVVLMNKLRRNEPFFLHLDDRSGVTSLWIHAAMPLVFHFYGSRSPALDRGWIDEFMSAASGPHGLALGDVLPRIAGVAEESRALDVDRVRHRIEETSDALGL